MIHDFDQADDGSPFIVMEWLQGRVLSEVIQRQGVLGLPRAVRLATQIAEGLEAAHRAGVIHRDVKPQNIMVLAATDDIKLMDFGIARLRDASGLTQLTRTGVMLGTPAYMAPEQIEGHEITPRVDIYAFGIVFYEMLTGVRPFRANTTGAVLAKHLREPPEAPSRLRPEIPREIEAIVLTALEKAPAHRQSSMGEIVRLLGEATRRMSDATQGGAGPGEHTGRERHRCCAARSGGRPVADRVARVGRDADGWRRLSGCDTGGSRSDRARPTRRATRVLGRTAERIPGGDRRLRRGDRDPCHILGLFPCRLAIAGDTRVT